MRALELSCAAAALLLLVNLFVRFERGGRGDRTLQAVLAVIVVDAALYPLSFATPTGLFKLQVGPYSVFLPEIVISLALAARLATRRPATRWSAEVLWWAAFFLWMLDAAALGILAGHPPNMVLFESKALLYVGGSFALAAGGGLSAEALLGPIRWAAPVAGLLVVLDQAGVRVTADLPLLPLRGFGAMGADAATIFGALGLVGLLLVAPARRRPLDAVAALVLTASPLVAQQRAALIGWAISVAVASGLLLLRRRRRLPAARQAALPLAATGLVAVLLLPVSFRLAREPATAVPLVGQIRQSFVRPAKQQSWQSRRNQWAVAPRVVAEHPWVGSGLGTTYWHYELAQNQLIETDVTHNLVLDLLLRTGVIGLSLFLLALSSSLRNGLAAVRLGADDVAAALCAGLLAVLAGLLAKGMVESILEKYRIAVLLGLSLGALRGAATPATRRSLPAPATEGGERAGAS
jgi:O-antigen ligase